MFTTGFPLQWRVFEAAKLEGWRKKMPSVLGNNRSNRLYKEALAFLNLPNDCNVINRYLNAALPEPIGRG